MVDRAELYEIADAIRGEGKVPSLRLVRGRLRNGGSFRDIGRIFLDWCIEREFHPRTRASGLPDPLLERLATVAAEVWRDGHRNGILAGQDQRDLLAIERSRSETLLVEALAMADALESERDRLLQEVQSAKAECGAQGIVDRRRLGVSGPHVTPPAEPPIPPRGTLLKLKRRMRDQDEWEPDPDERSAWDGPETGFDGTSE